MIKTDLLVIGTGLAGAVAAVVAADLGKQVIMATKTPQALSGSTPYAQGGIIYKGHHDSPEKLKNDILEAGDGHCWEKAVDELVNKGPELVEKVLFDRFKVKFDTVGESIGEEEYDLTAEGAHSEPRIIHSKDKTGRTIQEAVLDEIQKHPNIKILLGHTLVDLMTLSHHSAVTTDIYKKPACFGALLLDNETGKISPVYAQNTILATGGLGQIYLHTTNPRESTGDGISTAWRAGARCFNLQYIQFHPTTFYGNRERFLLSESMRGEGAVLRDSNGREFMNRFDSRGSLAPRDIVARGIHQVMLETDHPYVYLDITHKNSEWIKNRFPTIYSYCLKHGIDISVQPIPVVPAAHYSCGGVGVGINGKTSVKRLYAVGEVSCTGVHGANRLASTSLLEAVVWGYNAAIDSVNSQEDCDYFPEIYPWEDADQNADPALIAQDWLQIKNTMWNYVGLIRTQERLARASATLRHLQQEIDQFYRRTRMSKEIVELRNGVQTAIAVTAATREARVSLGAHYLAD